MFTFHNVLVFMTQFIGHIINIKKKKEEKKFDDHFESKSIYGSIKVCWLCIVNTQCSSPIYAVAWLGAQLIHNTT